MNKGVSGKTPGEVKKYEVRLYLGLVRYGSRMDCCGFASVGTVCTELASDEDWSTNYDHSKGLSATNGIRQVEASKRKESSVFSDREGLNKVYDLRCS